MNSTEGYKLNREEQKTIPKYYQNKGSVKAKKAKKLFSEKSFDSIENEFKNPNPKLAK